MTIFWVGFDVIRMLSKHPANFDSSKLMNDRIPAVLWLNSVMPFIKILGAADLGLQLVN